MAHSRRALPLVLIAIATILGLSFAGVARAQVAVSSGSLAGNPLVLHDPATGATAQMMPTTAFLAQHAPPYSSSGASSTTSTVAGALPAPTCTLGIDSSPGDAPAVLNGSSGQDDSLDISAFGLQSDTSNLTGQLSVQSLSDGAGGTPAVGGGGDVWYIVWNYGNTPGVKGYFVQAEYPGNPSDLGYTDNASTSNLPVDLTWGSIVTSPTGGDLFQAGGAASGSFDTTNSRITITAPLSDLGSPPSGAALTAPHALGDYLAGTSAGALLETSDTLDSSYTDYHAGQSGTNCPTPRQVPSPAGLPTAGSTSNLAYFGGPTVHTITNHIIWWLPKAGTTTYSDGSACTIPATTSYSYEQPTSGTKPVGALPGGPDGDADYQAIIRQYFNDLGGTSFYNLLSQYADEETGAGVNNLGLGGEWTDNCGYTSTAGTVAGPVPGGTDAAPIYEQDIENEVQKAIQVNHWPEGLGNEYFVYTGYGAADCFSPTAEVGGIGNCDVAGPNPGYCAYHTNYQAPDGNYVLFADMADGAFTANPSTVNLCYSDPIGDVDPTHSVNGNQVTDPIADAEVSITSHEEFETVNDAEITLTSQAGPPLAWYDLANGEIGDKCAYNYGNYSPTDGSNVNLHGDHYIVQQEYSNWNNGCALTSYQNNGGYGGDTTAVTIQKGTTLIGVPVSGITDTKALVTSMESAGNLPAGAITQVQVYQNGAYQTYKPFQGKAIPLTRTEGILVTSNVAGTWTPSGTPYTSGPTISLQPGWNLVAATYPNPGLMTDSIFNQIEEETGACTANVLTNGSCTPTITEIKSIGAGGQTIDWKPTPADSTGNATWPQTYGNQIPFTSGMWIYSTKAISWTVQGNACQTVDSSGVCH